MPPPNESVSMAGTKAKVTPHTLVLEHVAPATRLLEKRRQMFEVQESLEAQKLEFRVKEEGFKRREETLKKKDLDLQESLIRFSKFLQENDSKRSRAEKKAADEIKLRLQKEIEIVDLAETLGSLKVEKVDTSEIVEMNLSYTKYLESVLDIADEYHEIPDLLMRHATLEATNKDLRDADRDYLAQIEKSRAELHSYTKEKVDEVLNLNNKIARLKKVLETVERGVVNMAEDRDYMLQTASQKTLDHGQVCMATDNLFLRCSKRSSVNHPNYNNPLEQLHVIGDFMSDLSEIVKMKNPKS
uniref:DUF4200 domain-containing protein n=1 Tax=Mantoniella antarctica TaxID=81844 RepID=A0A7S0X210_9CHLO|mmetsp:Transcript_47092/g.75388  ORF Transcript_47092/g.75388 Transcript_47092/m.75388 type:complete len:300 (-) Transcript_47092:141-1040(-)